MSTKKTENFPEPLKREGLSPTSAQDYALSEKYVSPLYAKIQGQAIEEGFAHILLSPPEAIIDTFNYLDKNYGGINKYLRNIGMDKLQIERIQTVLVS